MRYMALALILGAILIGGCIAARYFVYTSDLPLWAKLMLLR